MVYCDVANLDHTLSVDREKTSIFFNVRFRLSKKKNTNMSWRGDEKSKIEENDGTQQNKNRDEGPGG